jgi:hypothetical protein
VEILQLGVDEDPRVEGPGSRRGVAPGHDQLGVGLDHVVLLQEGLFGQLPVHRQTEGVPPLAPHRLHLPGVQMVAKGSMHSRSGRGLVVEVDPGAAAPDLAAHRGETDVLRLQVVLGEGPGLRDEGVLAVGP